jgi:hypothetical protein
MLQQILGKQVVRHEVDTAGSINRVNGELCSDSYELFSFVTTINFINSRKKY